MLLYSLAAGKILKCFPTFFSSDFLFFSRYYVFAGDNFLSKRISLSGRHVYSKMYLSIGKSDIPPPSFGKRMRSL